MKRRLMIPGPVPINDGVMAEMGAPVRAHYGPAWVEYYDETRSLLGRVFRTEGDVYPIPGSGSAAIDACMGSALSTGQPAVIGTNGYFGQRLIEVATAHGAKVTPVHARIGETLEAEAFDAALDEVGPGAMVAVVQTETSAGTINPVREIAAVAQKHDAVVFVDGVASVGGETMNMDEWGIDLCASASQKALGGPPGLGLAAVGPRAWEAIDGADSHPGWYLDLKNWRAWDQREPRFHPTPVTMSANLIRGLRVALKQVLAEGLEARIARQKKLARYMRDGLARIGLEPTIDGPTAANIMTAVSLPAGVDPADVVTYLDDVHNIRISTGFGPTADSFLRIGHMGLAIGEEDIDCVLAGLAQYLAEKV